MMGCGFEHYLLTFQWDWSLILPAFPKIEISQDRRVPTASCLPTARLLGVCSSSELLTQIPLTRPELWCTPPAWCHVKLAVPTEVWRLRSGSSQVKSTVYKILPSSGPIFDCSSHLLALPPPSLPVNYVGLCTQSWIPCPHSSSLVYLRMHSH